MLVFWKENIAILSVPKTGTTALLGALAPRASMVVRDPPVLKHMPCYRYRRFIKPFFVQAGGKEPELMAIVRNPIDWLGSWYRYRHRDDLVGHENSTRGLTFDEFVLEYAKGKPAPFAAVGSQARFLTVEDGRIGVEHLFRYEAPERISNFLTQRLGDLPDIKRLNVSPSMELTLSPHVAQKLKDKRAAEFDVWERGLS